MKTKTSELTGPALDWAVAKCEGTLYDDGSIAHFFKPSTEWEFGGPIIERENICLRGEKPGFTAWVHQTRATIQGGPHSAHRRHALLRRQ